MTASARIILEELKVLSGDIDTKLDKEKDQIDDANRLFISTLGDIEIALMKRITALKAGARSQFETIIDAKKKQMSETRQQLEKLKVRVTKSEEWCQLQTQHPESIAKLQNDLKNDRVAFGRIESSALELRPVICCHVIDFIDHCNQLLDFQFEDTPSARRSNKWQCSERDCQSTLPFSSDSSFLEINGVQQRLSSGYESKEKQFQSDVDEFDEETEDNHIFYQPKPIIGKLVHDKHISLPGVDYGTISALSISNEGFLIALDNAQKALFVFNKQFEYISKIRLSPSHPCDATLFESREIVVTTLLQTNRNSIKVSSIAGNGKSLKNVCAVPIECEMKQHCVDVQSSQTNSNIVCIACPKEIRILEFDEHGKQNKGIKQKIIMISTSDDIEYHSLVCQRFPVKLSVDLKDIYVIKSNENRVVCFRESPLGQLKWEFKKPGIAPKDISVFQKHLLVTDGDGHAILELEAESGTLLQAIKLKTDLFYISCPYGIMIHPETQKLLLSQYSDSWDGGSASKRKLIHVFSFDTQS